MFIVSVSRRSKPFHKTIKCHNLATAQGLVRDLQTKPGISEIQLLEQTSYLLNAEKIAAYKRQAHGDTWAAG